MAFDNHSSIYYQLLALPNFGSLLHTGSHPDDEDTGLLTYFRCKYGIRSTYWCANRGESGMNRISRDQGDALGVIRSWEALEASEIGFFEYKFGPFRDFGFSYTASEGFTKWNEVDSVLELDWQQEQVTREIVRTIRATRPLIVVSRWSGTPKDFHGQHQTVGIATIHAFYMAGDPEMFKDLEEEGYPPWQPLKLYVSVNNPHDDQKIGGALNATLKRSQELERQKDVTWINTGEMDPYLKGSYQERAWASFNCHRSQSVAQVPRPGDAYYYYKLLESKLEGLESPDFFEGIGFSILDFVNLLGIKDNDLIKQMEKIHEVACQARDCYHLNPQSKRFETHLLKGLHYIQQALDRLSSYKIDSIHFGALKGALERKEEQYYRVIYDALGIRLEAISSKLRVVNFGKVDVGVNLWNYSGYELEDVQFEPLIPHDSDWEERSLEFDQSNACSSWQGRFELTIGNEVASTPYWLLHRSEDSSVYEWPDEKWCGSPIQPESYQVTCRFRIQGVPIRIQAPVVYHESVGVASRSIPLRIIEPISIEPSRTFKLISNRSNHQKEIEIQIKVRRSSEETRSIIGNLFIDCPEGCKLEPPVVPIHLDHPGDVVSAQFKIIPESPLTGGMYQVSCRFQEESSESSHLNIPVRKPGAFGYCANTCLNELYIRYPAEVRLSVLDMEFPQGMTYGLIPGHSNEMFAMVDWEQNTLQTLSQMDIEQTALNQFDAIIIGPNAYIENHLLQQEAARFLEYVHQGGTLIVMFQRYDYATPGYAPYRFSYHMPHNRVTDHKSPITLLEPDHSVFNFPNKITQQDFEGWHVDRGVYFWEKWDKRYQPLMRTGDPGDDPQSGGMMFTRYGRGSYIYLGYSFHRQIIQGVDGAFRICANILDLPRQLLEKQVRQLQSIPLFSKISPVMLEPIASKLEAVYLNKGDHLEYGTAPHQKLGFLEYGLLEKVQKFGESSVEHLIEPGQSFGEASLFRNQSSHHVVRAKEDSLILVLTIKDWWNIIQNHPSTVKPVMEYLARRGSKE